jgi:hypothetical protein
MYIEYPSNHAGMALFEGADLLKNWAGQSTSMLDNFLIYSSQVFFYLLTCISGFCFVGGYPHHCMTSYPTLII